ncbi:MAG: MotA/TolQ/ExbB proton channel family protein [Pseudomonadota bacterium]
MKLYLAQAAQETYGIDLVEVLTESSLMVQSVLLLLVLMSIACWFIVGFKWFQFHGAARANHAFLEKFWNSRQLDKVFEAASEYPASPVSRVFQEAWKEMARIRKQEDEGGGMLSGFENVERTIRRARQEELTRSERMIPFLGTTGSTAPFIGLFGTVWGIVEAFDMIPKDTGGMILDKVAGPMAHALIATAVGLLAAIPAVMAYNWFVRKIKVAHAEVDGFSSEFLNILRRHFFNK